MKRHPGDPRMVGLRRVWPLLIWYDCRCCGLEFRWEWGWQRVAAHPKDPLGGIFLGAVCGECAPTRHHAAIILADRPSGPPKVPAPKPPPHIAGPCVAPRDTRLRA